MNTTIKKALKYFQKITIARQKLKEMGVLRSEKDILVDYAEWLASSKYNLTLAKTGVNKTYDAIDSKGKTYQIKARRVKSINESTSFDFHNYEKFDYLIAVFIDKDTFKPIIEPIKIPFSIVSANWHKNSNRRCFRWNKTTRNLIKFNEKK